MRKGLEPTPFSMSDLDVSAPPSADFYLRELWAQMHQKPIAFKNGLVDPSSLLEYMGTCHCEDLFHSEPPGSHKTEYHHLYFPKNTYKSAEPHLFIRQLRNSKYNLIEMLSCQEDLYHQDVAVSVPQDEIDLEAAEVYLQEDRVLTGLAADSWMIAETEKALERSRWVTRVGRALLVARLGILEEMFYERAEKVDKIELIDSRVVSGALSRYLARQPEPRLQSFVDTRAPEDGIVIPTKIHDSRHFQDESGQCLNQRLNSRAWIVRKVFLNAEAEAA